MEREHNIINSLYLKPEELEQTNIERYKKYAYIEEHEPMYEEYLTDDAELIFAAFGIASRVARSTVNKARSNGLKVGMIRPITLWPFPKAPFQKAVANGVKNIISVELSMGQMIEDVKLATECKIPTSLYYRTGGMIPDPYEIYDYMEKVYEGGTK